MPSLPSPPVSPGIHGPSAVIVPVFSPPTPAPSPRPLSASSKQPLGPISFNRDVLPLFYLLSSAQRREFITQLVSACDLDQLVHANALIQPRLKRDFLRELPLEVALHVLSYVDDARTLARAAQVSRFWNALVADEWTWKIMCERSGYGSPRASNDLTVERPRYGSVSGSLEELRRALRRLSVSSTGGSVLAGDVDADESRISPRDRRLTVIPTFPFPGMSPPHQPAIPRQLTHQYHFKRSYLTARNWARGGRILRAHNSQDDGVVTSVAMDDEWIVVGLANHRIHVFSARTGKLARTLVGHTLGVWALGLVSKGGVMREPNDGAQNSDQRAPGALLGDYAQGSSAFNEGPGSSQRSRQGEPCNASAGWGQSGAVVVSGGCDREVRVWDLTTG